MVETPRQASAARCLAPSTSSAQPGWPRIVKKAASCSSACDDQNSSQPRPFESSGWQTEPSRRLQWQSSKRVPSTASWGISFSSIMASASSPLSASLTARSDAMRPRIGPRLGHETRGRRSSAAPSLYQVPTCWVQRRGSRAYRRRFPKGWGSRRTGMSMRDAGTDSGVKRGRPFMGSDGFIEEPATTKDVNQASEGLGVSSEPFQPASEADHCRERLT